MHKPRAYKRQVTVYLSDVIQNQPSSIKVTALVIQPRKKHRLDVIQDECKTFIARPLIKEVDRLYYKTPQEI